jgi:hypothetical protein
VMDGRVDTSVLIARAFMLRCPINFYNFMNSNG